MAKISAEAVAELLAVGVDADPEYDVDEKNECRHGVYRGGVDCPACTTPAHPCAWCDGTGITEDPHHRNCECSHCNGTGEAQDDGQYDANS
jgi:hypothetical protein